jgi:hypothetical protein
VFSSTKNLSYVNDLTGQKVKYNNEKKMRRNIVQYKNTFSRKKKELITEEPNTKNK